MIEPGSIRDMEMTTGVLPARSSSLDAARFDRAFGFPRRRAIASNDNPWSIPRYSFSGSITLCRQTDVEWPRGERSFKCIAICTRSAMFCACIFSITHSR